VFASSGLSCYLWIASKVHSKFGNEEDPLLHNAVRDVYERSTQKLFVMLREKSAAMLPGLRANWPSSFRSHSHKPYFAALPPHYSRYHYTWHVHQDGM